MPERVLQRRIVQHDDTIRPQVLIKWSDMHTSLVTWEDLEALQQRFLCTLARRQPGSNQGDVSTAPVETVVDQAEGNDQAARRHSATVQEPGSPIPNLSA